jgi:hypothetical protein
MAPTTAQLHVIAKQIKEQEQSEVMLTPLAKLPGVAASSDDAGMALGRRARLRQPNRAVKWAVSSADQR